MRNGILVINDSNREIPQFTERLKLQNVGNIITKLKHSASLTKGTQCNFEDTNQFHIDAFIGYSNEYVIEWATQYFGTCKGTNTSQTKIRYYYFYSL